MAIKTTFLLFFLLKAALQKKIVNNRILSSHQYLKNKNVNDILRSQFLATQHIFKKKNIPFRSFYLKKRNEENLGVLFIFFMLETILLGKAMNINPYDQPAVELIKTETKKILS